MRLCRVRNTPFLHNLASNKPQGSHILFDCNGHSFRHVPRVGRLFAFKLCNVHHDDGNGSLHGHRGRIENP